MGRLFWKLFATLFIAQLVTTGTVGALIWLRHVERASVARAQHRFDVDPGSDDPWRPPGAARNPWSALDGPDDRWHQGPPPAEAGGAWHRSPPPGLDGEFMAADDRGELPLLPMSVGLVASLVFALFLAHYLARPIIALRRAFDDVAHGRFEVNVAAQMTGRRDELADLGRQFDRTAEQLKGLLAHHRRLLHDVSHELRSPLARIQLAVDLARQQDDKMPALIERVEREATRIDLLIEELLTLSRLEAQPWIALEDEVDLVELVNDVVADARFEATAKHCQVELHTPSEARLTGHAELLHRAIENIVRNAVRYTFEGTTATVTITETRSHLRVSVCDDGPGIPDSALSAIFEPFVRLPEQRSIDGYGLGLAITQRIIVGHGGTIVASNRETGGLKIEIELPRRGRGS
jgi:signal transduction histidine kinase